MPTLIFGRNCPMKFSASRVICLFLIAGLIGLSTFAFTKTIAPPPATQLVVSSTLENLMKAYKVESNNQAKYLAYAKKADSEGYTQVGSLFRASAAAGKVHMDHLAEVIKKLGGTPEADINILGSKTTRENLEEALKGETYAKNEMYPDYIKQAREEKRMDAVRVFNSALQSESLNLQFYEDALKNLAQWKNGKKDFYVCPVCGYTVLKLDFKNCPICFTASEKFFKIN